MLLVCSLMRRPGDHSEGPNTRSHSELGREIPPRQWYCVSRRGRVGRRQVFPSDNPAQLLRGQTNPYPPRHVKHTGPAEPLNTAPQLPAQTLSRGGAAR
jgi:hypothetical protein